MIDLFPVPWKRLELADLRTFLEDAGEEGVTWEAKADDERGALRPDSIRKAACGLANQIGGYVIVGAKFDKKAGEWKLPGVKVPDPEPELWLGKVLRPLNPTPRFDPKAWTLEDGRTAAVVRVEQVEVAPCMTPQGRVYERVTGETLPVEDPALLDALFRRGRSARERAEQFAHRAGGRARTLAEHEDETALIISVSLAAVGRLTDDISSRLFVPSFAEAAAKAMWQFFGDHRDPEDIQVLTEQDALAFMAHFGDFSVLHGNVSNRGKPWNATWLVQATWDGTVTACASFAPQLLPELTSRDRVVLPGWREIAGLVELLGGYGPAHLSVAVEPSIPKHRGVPRTVMRFPDPPPPPDGTLYARLTETTVIERWVSVGEPSEDVLDSIERELYRASGHRYDEPEPEED